MDPAGRAQQLNVYRPDLSTRSEIWQRFVCASDRHFGFQQDEMSRSPSPRYTRSIGGIIAAPVFAAAPLPAGAVAFPDETYHSLPCRPTIACTADFVPPGVVELEMGYIYRRLGIGANQHSAPFLLKLTLADWVQFQFGSNGLIKASQPAPALFFDDVTFGLKFHLHDQSDYFPSLSFSTTASLPTVAAEGYFRTYDLFLVAYVTKDIGWLHADLNLGTNLWRIEKPVSTQPWAALALSVQLPHGLGLMLEGLFPVQRQADKPFRRRAANRAELRAP